MRFRIVEGYTTAEQIKYLVKQKINYVNAQLDKDGLCVEYIEDYDFDAHSNEWIAVFCSDVQDSADTFPISINIEYLSTEAKKDIEIANDMPYHIEKSIWHEVGHGIQSFLSDEYDYADIERSAEEYAEYMMSETSHSEIYDDLKEYNEQYGA